MGALNGADYRAILAFLEGLYGHRDAETLPEWLLHEITGLVGGHHCSWSEVAFGMPRARVVEYPRLDNPEARSKTFSKYLFEHPGIVHSLSAGDPSPFVLSDALTEEELHGLQLYQCLYRQMDYEDQIGMLLSPPKGRVAGLALARDRRGFSARDREVMALVRPHIGLAHSNLRALARGRARLGDDAGDVALLELDVHGGVRRGMSRAEPMLSQYFRSDRRRAPGRLPRGLVRWLERRSRAPLVLRRGKRRLVARFFQDARPLGLGGLILLEDRVVGAAASRLRAEGLTARELEVLAELEKGLSNNDIAAALFVSPRTVKKHLERIYAKLGVRSRAGAVMRMRETARGP